MKNIILALVICMALCTLHATTYYVSTNGNDSADGLTRETALKDLTTAIMRADTDDTVFMLNGTHVFTNKAEFIIPKRITLCGEDRDLTIVDNQNKGGTFKSQSSGSSQSAGTIYHSFTITRCGSNYSGSLGIITTGIATYKTVVSNMVFRQLGNTFSGNARYPLNVSDHGHVSYCYFTNNIAPNNCAVTISGSTLMENCYIADNVSLGKSSSWYGVVDIAKDSCVFRNNTIVNNKCDKGALSFSCANPKVYNNIIWGNTYYSSSSENNVFVNGKTVSFCKGNCTTPLLGSAEDGNITSDPLFADDWKHFAKASPCNGHAFAYAASDWYPEYDLEYSVRPAAPSIGAFEYVASSKLSVKITASSSFAISPVTITLGAEPDGAYALPLSYAWDFNGDGIVDSTVANPVLSGIGVYNPSVTITDSNSKSASDTYPNRLIIYSSSGIVYVTSKENPNAKPPFATLETASTNLLDAVEYALNGSVLELDDGIHYVNSTINITRNYTIRSKNGPDVTFLAKRSGAHQLFVVQASDAAIDGFTVQEQNFENYAQGAAIATMCGTVRNCRFIRNKVIGHGQVSAAAGGSGSLFENLVFIGNSASLQGPAGTKFNSACTMRNSFFYANTNKVNSKETGYYGGAIHGANNGDALIENCTIVSNVSWNAGEAGIYAACRVRNTVVAFNVRKVGDEYVDSNEVATNRVSYSCLYPVTNDYSKCAGVMAVDPEFISVGTGDLHLTSGSPCLRAGRNFAEGPVSDLDGNVTSSRKLDLGCYFNKRIFTLLLLK